MLENVDVRVIGPWLVLLFLTFFIGGGVVFTYLQSVRDIQKKIFAAFNEGGILAVEELYEVLSVETGRFLVDWLSCGDLYSHTSIGLERLNSGVIVSTTNFPELIKRFPKCRSIIAATVVIIREPWRNEEDHELAFILEWDYTHRIEGIDFGNLKLDQRLRYIAGQDDWHVEAIVEVSQQPYSGDTGCWVKVLSYDVKGSSVDHNIGGEIIAGSRELFLLEEVTV